MAFWNDIAPGGEADFHHWHVFEHVPERVGIPGFLRGRRYVSDTAQPKFFNFYETESVAILTSDAYLARLNDPTPWTRASLANFRNANRTLCAVAASHGRGIGSAMLTLQCAPTLERRAELQDMLDTKLFPELLTRQGIVGAHHLVGDEAASHFETQEKSLRDQPDAVADWVILVEAVEEAALTALRNNDLADGGLSAIGVGPAAAGIYRLHYCLDQNDLSA